MKHQDKLDTPDSAVFDEDEVAATLIESLRRGISIRELKGVDQETMEAVYAYAHQFYLNGQLDEAEQFFRFLYLYDFHNGDYAMGLASVHQLKKQYQKAIDMYAVAYALVRQDERPLFHAGQCHLAMGRKGMARGCFNDVATHSRDEDLVSRAKAYLEVISGADKPKDVPNKSAE